MPTNKNAPITPGVPVHKPEVGCIPTGGFSVHCAAFDWFSDKSFATHEEVLQDAELLAHLFAKTGHHLAVRFAHEQPHFYLGCTCGWAGDQRFKRRFDAQMDPAGDHHLDASSLA